MKFLAEMLRHTPPWVWALFFFLIWLGWKSGRPGRTSLLRLGVIPATLSFWGLYELVGVLGITPLTAFIWIAGFIMGGVVGIYIAQRLRIVGCSNGELERAADRTALPIIVLAFVIKYATAVAFAVSPHFLRTPIMAVAIAMTGGLFPGVFVGKFAVFVGAYARRLA